MNGLPEPPEEHYVGVGHVIHAYSMLELQIGLLGHAAATGENWTEDWKGIAGSPHIAFDLCKKAEKLVPAPLAKEISALRVAAKAAQQQRDRFAHAVFIFDPDVKGNFVLKSAKDKEFAPLTDEVTANLVRTIVGLSDEAARLRSLAAADFRSRDHTEPDE